MQVLNSDTTDTVPMDMYTRLTEQMSPEEIREWLYSVVHISCAHMNSCGDDAENLDEIDESFLMFENAVLYLIGLCESNSYFHQEEMH